MTGTAIVYGILAIVFALGLSKLRVVDALRLFMVPVALGLAIAGFFVAGFLVGLLAWCVFAGLTTVVAVIVQRHELKTQKEPGVYLASSLLGSMLTWPIAFPFLTQPNLGELDGSGADAGSAMPTVRIETDGAAQLPDAGAFADVLGENLEGKVKGEAIGLDVHDLGKLSLPSGRVIACDGFILDSEPFETSLPPGDHPVLVAVAKLPDGDERIAFARVQLSDQPTVRWTAATCPGEDSPKPDPDERFGYGVDSGLGAFVASEAIEALQEEIPDHMDYVIRRMGETTRSTWCWARARGECGNGIIFSSGYGDGLYTTYLGYDADGAVTALLTSFDVVAWDP